MAEGVEQGGEGGQQGPFGEGLIVLGGVDVIEEVVIFQRPHDAEGGAELPLHFMVGHVGVEKVPGETAERLSVRGGEFGEGEAVALEDVDQLHHGLDSDVDIREGAEVIIRVETD